MTTIMASIISGLLGVLLTLVVQRVVCIQEQKVFVFRTLLANRHQITSDESVKALNMIDVVFYQHKDVRKRFEEFIEASNKKPVDGNLIITKYLRLVESVGVAVGMNDIDWERINYCYYNPIALAERTQENDLLRKARLRNQMCMVNQNIAVVNPSMAK